MFFISLTLADIPILLGGFLRIVGCIFFILTAAWLLDCLYDPPNPQNPDVTPAFETIVGTVFCLLVWFLSTVLGKWLERVGEKIIDRDRNARILEMAEAYQLGQKDGDLHEHFQNASGSRYTSRGP